MAGNKNEEFSINTMVGANTRVNGDIEAAGFTRIDGSVRGKVQVKGRVVVGEEARMRSDVSGSLVTIGGVVHGNVIASEHLIILSTAIVLGNIITRRIQADEGCLIHGKVKVCSTEESWNKALSEYRDSMGLRSSLQSFLRSHG